jgi:hypothetical protein
MEYGIYLVCVYIPIYMYMYMYNFTVPYNGSCLNMLVSFGIFCGNLVYFTAIWYICWSFGTIFVGHLVYFSRFGILYQEKSGNPGPPSLKRQKLFGSLTEHSIDN